MTGIKLKLCGFKKLDDINFALNAGVDFVGLNNISISKRFIGHEEILALLKAMNPEARKKIIVLLNHFDSEFLLELKELGVEYIQSYLLEAEDKVLFAMNFKVIKVFSIASDGTDLETVFHIDLAPYEYLLLDTKVGNALGGTGKTFDWSIFRDLQSKLDIKMILAGGLNRDNILEAIKESNSSFLDIAGGVEEQIDGNPTQKSYALIKELVSLVK